MTKIALTFAAALIAGATFVSTAQAGGCGGYSSGGYSSGGSSYQQSGYAADKRRAQAKARARAVAQAKARRQAQARAEAKAEARAKAARIAANKRHAAAKRAQLAAAAKAVRVAHVNTSATMTDAAPTIVIPEAASSKEPVKTAALTPIGKDITSSTVKVGATTAGDTKIDEDVTAEAETATIAPDVKRVCRKFSATVGGLIEIACE